MAIRLKKGFVLRKVGPKCMAVPFGKMASQIHGMITLSETGSFLWEKIAAGVDNQPALVEALLAEYAISDNPDEARDIATRDVAAFIDGLMKQGALEEV